MRLNDRTNRSINALIFALLAGAATILAGSPLLSQLVEDHGYQRRRWEYRYFGSNG